MTKSYSIELKLYRKSRFLNYTISKKLGWVTDSNFVHVLSPDCAILRRIFTSGILHVRLLPEISIHSTDPCILAISCVGYALAAKNRFEPPQGHCSYPAASYV